MKDNGVYGVKVNGASVDSVCMKDGHSEWCSKV